MIDIDLDDIQDFIAAFILGMLNAAVGFGFGFAVGTHLVAHYLVATAIFSIIIVFAWASWRVESAPKPYSVERY